MMGFISNIPTDTMIGDTAYAVSPYSTVGITDVKGFQNGTMVYHYADITNEFNSNWVLDPKQFPPVQVDTIIYLSMDLARTEDHRVGSAVPSPATLVLLATAAAFMTRRRRA